MKKPTIQTLQAMRAFAAAIVVVYHCQRFLNARGYIPEMDPLFIFGRGGVDIFFVISGFIMTYISWGLFEKPGATRDFLIKRLIRIVPIYWFYSFAMVFLLVAFSQFFSGGKTFILPHAIASFLFIPWENSIGQMLPVLPQGWTLSYEMYFYFIVGFLLLFPRKYFLPIISAWLLGGIVLGLLFKPASPILHVASSILLIEFLMGCLVGLWYRQGIHLQPKTAVLTAMAGLGLYIAFIYVGRIGMIRVVAWGIPAVFVMAGLVHLERTAHITIPRILVALGDSSYSLYLSHLFTVNLVGVLWFKIIGAHIYLYMVVAFVVSLIVGHLSYLLLEKPAIGFLNARYARHKESRGNKQRLQTSNLSDRT